MAAFHTKLPFEFNPFLPLGRPKLHPSGLTGNSRASCVRGSEIVRSTKAALVALAASCYPPPATAQFSPREPTDLYIRRLAGLSAATAKGQVEIIDVGHDPLSTMLSIVGNRTPNGWSVSYACAASPHCAPGADHLASTYTLSPSASAEVDEILKSLRSGVEPDGQPPASVYAGGQLLVAIDYNGFKRDYRRVGIWGKTLGRLEELMSTPPK